MSAVPPYLTTPRSRPGPRRRSLLTGAAGVASAALLAGCTDTTDTDERPSATRRLRARTAEDSRALLARYDAVLAAHPSLAGRLGPLRDEVRRHAEAFEDDGSTAFPSAAPSASASPSASTSASAKPSPKPSVASDPKRAVRDLAKAERELADRRAEALLDAPAEQARLLASVAAAGAAHAYLLTEDDK
ncbi:hypothetical protein [Streptomyces luteocolor]|uniref:hypothetical protein n=1 Tax=Streptomyces luteocolor TaxID=285500 RepID=UPI00085380BC|nr:hypothetical protein [Streptomyces luteocolor]